MFAADWTWVGVVVGAAAVAARTYRRGTAMMYEGLPEEKIHLLRNYLWGTRDAVLDAVLLHECDIHRGAYMMLELAELTPDRWLAGAVLDDRHLAESHRD